MRDISTCTMNEITKPSHLDVSNIHVEALTK